MIPDFAKLGYEITALTFVNTELGSTIEEIEKAREFIREKIKETPLHLIMVERGKGMKYDGVIISLHKTYESFNKLRDRFRQYPFMQPDLDSFLISLHDENRYLPLTLLKEFMEKVVKPNYPGGISPAIKDLMRKAVEQQKQKEKKE